MEERYEGKVRVHPIENSYNGIHVDTTFTILGYNKKVGKNLVMVDGKNVNHHNMPAIFRGSNWAVIEVKEYDQEHFDEQFDYVSDAIGLNFLMVNPELAIISDRQHMLKKTLEFYGIEVIMMKNKHTKQLAGGFHCSTNEINRQDVHGFGEVLEAQKKDLSGEQLAGLFDFNLLKLLEESGNIEKWVEICNQKEIFAEYLTGHLE